MPSGTCDRDHHGTPFAAVVNRFTPVPGPARVRGALDLAPEAPDADRDARDRESCKHVLITLVEHLAHLYGIAPAEVAS